MMLDPHLCIAAVNAFCRVDITEGTCPAGGSSLGIAINCLPFDDPNRDRSISRHCGTMPRILAHLSSMEKAHVSMNLLGAELARQHMLREKRTLILIFVCRQGRHRSVAMSVALRLAIWRDPRFAVSRVMQLTDLGRDSGCKQCHECNPFPLNREDRLEAARPLIAAFMEGAA